MTIIVTGYSKGDATFSGSYNNNAFFKSDGTLTLNASGTLDINGGIFETDSLILNAGTLTTGTGCAVFKVNKYSSIQNGSGISAVPPGSTGILDLNNPGQIDNVATGCGGTDVDQKDNASVTPASPNSAGPYCGIIPLTTLNSAGGCFTTLPITWIGVSAERISPEKIQIKWIVEENEANLLYEIQYSDDGFNFYPVGIIKPNEISANATYSFFHENLSDITHYYRIKQIDKNGNSSFSRMVAVGEVKNNVVYVFPNPANDFFTVMSKIKINYLSIYSTEGKLVNTYEVNDNTQIDISQFARGVYFLKAYTDHKIYVTKLIKH